MSDAQQRIDCGDTEHCKQCIYKNARSTESMNYVKSLVLNSLGRCDFYHGPDKVVHNTAL
ncbi:hypothetical protein V5T82_02150 [Magnetovibrio sp. PR-2]|uniref:hypothetical protein n=1 Tax=Magnetovibrio sp. PR-2 TaxID=3120356 RepID=UPI002FCDF468